MATKLVKINDVDEALRLWKAGLLVGANRKEWLKITRFDNDVRMWMWDAYMLVDADEE